VKKSVALLFVFVFLAASCLIVSKPAFSSAVEPENTWTQKASMQAARSDLRAAVVNGKIYAIGGRGIPYQSPTSTELTTNEEYDPKTNTWTFKAPMPAPSSLFAIAVCEDRIYCMGSGKNQVYDPATDTWEIKTAMPTTRTTWATASVVDGKIYVIGGLPNGTLNEMYDPATDTWTTKASMPTAAAAASGVFNGKIYIVGSYYETIYFSVWWSNDTFPELVFRSITQIYDPSTDTWSVGASPPTAFYIGYAVVTTGFMALRCMYIFSAGDQGNQVYDFETDSWTYGADIPTSRGGFAVAVVDDLIYVIGGEASTHLTDLGEILRSGVPFPGPIEVTYYATAEAYTPFGYGTVPPVISVASPENRNYTSSEVALNFTVNRQTEWMGYSLDGSENVTVTGSTTLMGLSSGLHNVTVYVKDEFGNTGASETVSFTVAAAPFPVVPVAAASVAVVAVIGVALLVYFKKRKR
jgi:hypothetical protein